MIEGDRMEKLAVDNLMRQYKVQPVGQGYIDCIVSMDNVEAFIKKLSEANVKISTLTWWCHCKGDSLTCPHGMGGPLSYYYSGWFSEMCYLPTVEFQTNEQVLAYLKSPNDIEMLDCFVPAVWLDVPDTWTNPF